MKIFKRKIKKRYIALSLFLLLFSTCRSGLLSFRSSEKKQAKYFEKKGQTEYSFHTVKTGDRTVHYTHTGKEGLPLVIFLHGSPGSSSAFKSYLGNDTLSKEIQMISVDRPGNGYSDYGKSVPSFTEQAVLMKPILERHKAPYTILVGHSLGGPIIVKMAMDYPELIDGLVIVAGSIAPELEPKEWHRKPMNSPLVRWMIPKSFVVSNQEILETKEELIKMLPDWEKVKVPVTVIQGDSDGFVPKGNADFAEKMLVNSEKVDIQIIENGNHFIVWSEYDKVVKSIFDMIAYLEL